MTSASSASASLPSSPARAPLRVGIIGCGWFGRVHVERLSALPNVHLCAVSDPDAAARQRLADLVPPHARDPQAGVATYADYRDLLRQGELPEGAPPEGELQAEGPPKRARLDFVSINSPNQWHVEQLLAALECDLHVLCEKPLSMEPDAVRGVVAATQASGKIVAIAYQSRYRRDARVLRQALQSGRWGRITSVAIFGSEDWITPNVGTWRHDPARCPGGFFGDANGHQLDLLFWLTGLQASWVRATTENRGTPVPMVTWGEARLVGADSESARLECRGAAEAGDGESLTAPRPQALTEGVPFTFTFVGDARRWREEISIQTERADFVIRDTRLLWTDGSAPLGPFPDSEADPVALGQPDLPDSALVAALRGGPPILSPPETVWPVLRFTRAALESAARGNVPISTFGSFLL